MSLSDLLKTKRAKVITGYIYSMGASVVLIGALFKLQHWPYSGPILTVGLLTEAFIFLVSAFEPPLDMPEWSKVYPELREDFDGQGSNLTARAPKSGFDALLGTGDLNPEILAQLNTSLSDLNTTAKGISDITSATLATDTYVRNLKAAGEAMNSFSETNAMANSSLHKSVNELVEVYHSTSRKISASSAETAEKLSKSGEEISIKLSESGSMLAQTYKAAAEKMNQSVHQLEQTADYAGSIARLNQNLAALNSVIENQLKGTETQFKAGQKFNEDFGKMNDILAVSLDEMKKYQENAVKLNQHLEALNTVYGNMLGAMNYKK